MGFRDRWVDLLYRAATGTRKTRALLTPVGLTVFAVFTTVFVLAAVLVDGLLDLPALVPEAARLPLALPLIALGAAVTAWSALHFLRVRGTPVPFNPPPEVVQTGPYRYVRNPMVTGVFVLLFGIGFAINSASLVCLFTPLYVLVNVWELKRIEEPELARRLGEEYIEYRKRTPMFLPRFGRGVDAGRPPSAILLAIVLAAVAWPATAQEEGLPTLEFSFSNPGARSMGFGGAFVALADDATAAFANPAGLVQLLEPEVSIEGRSWGYSTPNVEGGRFFGPPSGQGLDTSPGLRVGESSAELSGLSFLSLVYPGRDWSVAFYRHQLANYEFYGETGAIFAGPWPGLPGSRARSWDLRKAIDLEIVGYGVSGGYRLTERVSVGLGLSYFDGRMATASEVFAAYATDTPTDFQFFHAESQFAPEMLVSSQSLTIDDTGWGVLAGILLQLSGQWTVGAVAREGPELNGLSRTFAGPLNDEYAPGELVQSTSGEILFPGVFGLGIAFRSGGDRLTVAFEWDRVTYSDILESTGTSPEFVVEDADELHAGAEWAFLGSRPVAAVRLGAWLDPSHRVYYRGGDYVAQAVLGRGSDEIHLAAGLGFAFERFQIDLGVDLSDLADTASLSAIYSF